MAKRAAGSELVERRRASVVTPPHPGIPDGRAGTPELFALAVGVDLNHHVAHLLPPATPRIVVCLFDPIGGLLGVRLAGLEHATACVQTIELTEDRRP